MFTLYKIRNGERTKVSLPQAGLDEIFQDISSLAGFIVSDGEIEQLRRRGVDIGDKGLYRAFSLDERSNRQFVVCQGDVVVLAEAVAHCLVHGIADKVMNWSGEHFGVLLETLCTRNIKVTCGTAARLLSYLYVTQGYETRVLSLENQHASLGTSHIVTEVFFEQLGKFVLLDVDLGCVFLGDGVLLNFKDLRKFREQNRTVEVRYLAARKKHDMDALLYDFLYTDRELTRHFIDEVIDSHKITVSEWIELESQRYITETKIFGDSA
jgi:hypothetical protein